jgi:putative FmdB family regulatory protein
MPTYEYECPSCGYKFEVFQSIMDDPISECPRCHKKPHRIISGGAGLIFKGTGFYETDYKRKESGIRSKESDSSPKTESTSKSESSKTASKD